MPDLYSVKVHGSGGPTPSLGFYISTAITVNVKILNRCLLERSYWQNRQVKKISGRGWGEIKCV